MAHAASNGRGVAPVGVTIPGGPDGASHVRSLKLDIFLLPAPDQIGAVLPLLECGDWSPLLDATGGVHPFSRGRIPVVGFRRSGRTWIPAQKSTHGGESVSANFERCWQCERAREERY